MIQLKFSEPEASFHPLKDQAGQFSLKGEKQFMNLVLSRKADERIFKTTGYQICSDVIQIFKLKLTTNIMKLNVSWIRKWRFLPQNRLVLGFTVFTLALLCMTVNKTMLSRLRFRKLKSKP